MKGNYKEIIKLKLFAACSSCDFFINTNDTRCLDTIIFICKVFICSYTYFLLKCLLSDNNFLHSTYSQILVGYKGCF